MLALSTWGSAALHPRLYAAARIRGLAKQSISQPHDTQRRERLSVENDLPGLRPLPPEVIGHVHPADLSVRGAGDEHHGIGLRFPLLGVVRIVDREDVLAVAALLGLVKVRGLELQIDSPAAVAA